MAKLIGWWAAAVASAVAYIVGYKIVWTAFSQLARVLD